MPYKDKQIQIEYQRQWIAKRRVNFFADKCCVLCGSKDNLELDHVDRKTKVSHKIWSWSLSRREAELQKCQTLCASCHLSKTKLENSRPITHGNSGYDRFCRCEICTEAHSQRMKLRKR